MAKHADEFPTSRKEKLTNFHFPLVESSLSERERLAGLVGLFIWTPTGVKISSVFGATSMD